MINYCLSFFKCVVSENNQLINDEEDILNYSFEFSIKVLFKIIFETGHVIVC